VTLLSDNKIPPNKPMNKRARPARYGSVAGKGGPAKDHWAPIVRKDPIAATDMKQYMVNTRYNSVPDEFGVTSGEALPMQQITPTRGGKYSGRTGPMN
jgi:hypothetical protein